MSARSPILRLPGRPWMTPMMPVLPKPRWTSMPQDSSFSATMPEVRTSSKPISGWAWKSRRQAVISSWKAAMRSMTGMVRLRDPKREG